MFVALEVDIALICASAPALKPLFKRYFKGTTIVEMADSRREYQRQPSRCHVRGGGVVDIEAGTRSPGPVELQRVRVSKTCSLIHASKMGGHVEKALPPEPWARHGCILKKEDSESEEFWFERGAGSAWHA